MASVTTITAYLGLLMAFPLTALSASLPDTQSASPVSSSTVSPSASPVSEGRSVQHHLPTSALVAIIITPILVVLVVGVSLYVFCRARGRGLDFGTTKIREIVSPITPTENSRNPFYELGRKAGYESITPLHPTLDQDSPRSSTFTESWRHGHTRNDTVSSIGSTGSLHMTMSGGLPTSPRLGGQDHRWSGRYTPVSGRESPALGHTRTRTQTSVSSISLPLHAVEDSRRCSSPLAWTAESIMSDGSDRATPVPWEHRVETEYRSQSRSTTPVPHAPRALSPEQDIASMSPYYDPHIAARRMSIPMVLSIPATSTPQTTSIPAQYQPMSERTPIDEEDEVPEMQSPVDARDEGVSRSQTQKSMNSVTTIRTSVDTQFTDWQLPSVEEHEEMPKLPPTGLQRSSAIRRASSGLSGLGLS